MLRPQRILCPVDLSDASRRALDYGLALAREHDAAVHVVQVVDLHGWAGATVEGLDALLGPTRESLEEQLGWWVARGSGGRQGASTELRDGPVVPGILAAARDAGTDLIVMGTHGRSGVERFALGSIAEKVLRRAACPVIVVPSREDAIVRAGRLTRVVCATDFSSASTEAVFYGRLFTAHAPQALSLLTVIDWPFGDTHGREAVTRLRESLDLEATDRLRRLATDAGVADAAVLIVRHGKAGPEVLRYARECHAELLVLGVSGRGAIDRALLGSTAHQVLRDAPCPVLTVPAPAPTH